MCNRGLHIWSRKPQYVRAGRLNSHPRFACPLLIINQTQVLQRLAQSCVKAHAGTLALALRVRGDLCRTSNHLASVFDAVTIREFHSYEFNLRKIVEK